MANEILQNLGLSKNESKIYFALVKLKTASVNELSREANVHRVNTYDILQSLKAKGLVGTITKANKMFFEPANPEILSELLEKKKKELSETENSINSLKSLFEAEQTPQDVKVFKGKIGIKTILKDTLTSKTEILNFGSSGMFPSYYSEYFDIWESQRAKQKIKMRIVTSKSMKGKTITKKIQTIRFLNMKFKNQTSTFIYEDKVAIFLWTENPLAILIRNKEFSNSNRNYFEYLWTNSEN
jgi:sugar-specific transcriptional regulator TrmB